MPPEKEIRPRTPTPGEPVRIWPTPNKTDLLFYVERLGDLPKDKNWKYGDPFEDTIQFPHHKLIYVTPQDAEKWSKWYYAVDREYQDLYNYKWTSTEIGSRNYESVTRSYLIPRADFVAGTVGFIESRQTVEDSKTMQVAGTPMPLVPESVFDVNYSASDFVCAHARQERAPQELDSLYVAVDVVWVRRCSTESLGWDDATSGILTKTSTLYYRGETVVIQYGIDRTPEWLFANPENSFWGLSLDGVVTDGEKLGCDWYVIEEREVVPGGLTSSSSGGGHSSYGKLIRSYGTYDNITWPAIFADGDFRLQGITKYVDKNRTSTYTRDHPRVQLKNPMYRGLTKVRIDEYWSKLPVTLPAVKILMGKEISYQGAQYNFGLQPTLHAKFYLVDVIGTEDPEYPASPSNVVDGINLGVGEAFDATTDTDWPASMTVGADQTPFRGGYKITIVTAYRPPCYVP